MNKKVSLGKNGGRLGSRAFIKDLLLPGRSMGHLALQQGDLKKIQSGDEPSPPRRDAPELLEVFGRIEAQLRLTQDRRAAKDFSMEVRLAWLTGHIGNLANNTSHDHNLLRTAAVTIAWLEAMHLPMTAAFTAIADERARHPFEPDARKYAPDAHGWRKLRALVEKLGLVAQAVAEVEAHPQSAACRNFLLAMLVQVAASAVEWQEQAGHEETFNVEYRMK